MLLSNLVAPIALAATVLADGAAINSALKTVDTSINSLTASLTGFSGDIFGSIPILGASLALKSNIEKANKVANDSQPLTSDDTLSLADTVNIIITDATKSIDAFIAVKPKFDKLVIVTPIATGQIKDLKKATAALGDAIIAKVPADFKDVATQLVGQINEQFDRGIAAYGGGGSALPGLPGMSRSSRLARHV
ncbi:hydrophobic surface binding protein A domain-containing protein [Cordyceps javanica]|uniref:Hydrophobic surface binding protein A domain-containing protein n=1 Tax=Cordyceps javanica TaxID=43265 RepID=A0A545VT78_9HYPO|nr:hydrophobic surface binding protein A domain-containing protein [Cordyceps javanica]TQW04885.1 hydrophobic surface binding protein A domain-containing protein [Cordyceps javanica]